MDRIQIASATKVERNCFRTRKGRRMYYGSLAIRSLTWRMPTSNTTGKKELK